MNSLFIYFMNPRSLSYFSIVYINIIYTLKSISAQIVIFFYSESPKRLKAVKIVWTHLLNGTIKTIFKKPLTYISKTGFGILNGFIEPEHTYTKRKKKYVSKQLIIQDISLGCSKKIICLTSLGHVFQVSKVKNTL